MTFDRHAFWKDPTTQPEARNWIRTCSAAFYLDLHNITAMVVDAMTRYADKDMSIIELGCGTGRNLAGLYKAGFKNLAGIEINAKTVELGRENFPEYREIPVTIAPVEDVIKDLPEYDVIFTQGFLQHLPPGMEWVIEQVAYKAQHMILTNEGEVVQAIHSWHHNYPAIFEGTDRWEQVETGTGDKVPPLPRNAIKRIFLRTKEE